MMLICRWRRWARGKRGSSAVMLTCIFVSILIAAGSVCEAASRRTSVSAAECTFDVAGRSVLAGYDRSLKERYALFAYEYDESDIEEMLRNLSKETLASFPLTECRVTEVSVEKSG